MATNTDPPEQHSEAIIERDEGQFRLRHSDPKDHIWKTVRETGAFYEAEFLEVLRKDLKAGDLVLDVGANIGNHSIYFAGVCDAHVIAFEPNPAALTLLKENIAANGLRRRVEVRDYALGAEAGQADFDLTAAVGNLGAVRLKPADAGAAKVQRLDDVELPGPPRLIKIDAEGMDFDVLRGAEALLREHQPIVAVEAGDRKHYNEVADFLGELGYVRRDSLNYTPTHIFVPVPKGKATQFNRHVARELGGAYVDMATARASADQRISRINMRLGSLEVAGAKVPAETAAAFDRKKDEIVAASREMTIALAADVKRVEASIADAVKHLGDGINTRLGSLEVAGAKVPAETAAAFDRKKDEIVAASREMTAALAADVKRVEASIADAVANLEKRFADTNGDLAQQKASLVQLATQLSVADKTSVEGRAALNSAVKHLGESIDTRFQAVSKDYQEGQESILRISMRVRELQAALARLTDSVGQVTHSIETRFHETGVTLKWQTDAANFLKGRVVELGASVKQLSANLGDVGADIEKRFQAITGELKLAAEANRLISARSHNIESSLLDLGSNVADIGNRLDQTRTEIDAGLRSAAAQNEVLANAFGALDGSLTARLQDIGKTSVASRENLDRLNLHTLELQSGLSQLANRFDVVSQGVAKFQQEAASGLSESRDAFEAGFGELRKVVLENLTDTVRSVETRIEAVTSKLAKEQTATLSAGQDKLLQRLERFDGKLQGRLDTMEADILAGMEISSRMGLWVDRKIEDIEMSLAARIAASVEDFRKTLADELRVTANAQLESVGKAVADIMLELDRRQPDSVLPPAPPHRRIDFEDPNGGGGSWLPTPKAPAIMRPARLSAAQASAATPTVSPSLAVAATASAPKPQVAAAPLFAVDVAAIPGETLAAVDFTTDWKGLAWPQAGAVFQDGGVVQYTGGSHWPGFVTAKYPAMSGGVLRVVVDIADVAPGSEVVARLRNDRDELCGPDIPLTKGLNTFRMFAPERTSSLKAYILVRPPGANGAFAVRSIRIDRLDADAHQRAVRAVIGQPVLASMATIPSRQRMLADCVNSLLTQCDRVRVYLNNYPDVPEFLNHPRIDVRRSQDWDDRGDAGKMFWIDRDKEEGYRLVTDDDLLFPPDFAETMCGKVRSYDDRAIFGLHAILLRQPLRQYYDPDSRAATFHFTRALDADTPVHIGGTATMCFHSKTVNMKWADFSYCNSADVWISLYAQRHKLPIFAASRPQGWVRENVHDAPEETIYHHSRKRTRTRMDSSLVQDAALRHGGPLTLQPTHRPKLGLAVVVEDVSAFKSFIDGWMATRSANIDWVVSLIPATSPQTFRDAIGNIIIEHETHLFDADAPLEDRIHAARRLMAEIGVQATLYVTESMTFPAHDWEAAVFSPSGVADPTLVLRGVPGGGTVVGAFSARDGHLGKAFVERTAKEFGLFRTGATASTLVQAKASAPATAALMGGVFLAPSIRAPAVLRSGRRPAGRRINDMFERVVVLNLDRRPDRWAQAQRQLEQAGITAERFSAVDGSVPEVDAEYQEYAALPLITPPKGQREMRYSEDFYIRPESQAARIAFLEQRSGRKAVASRGAWGYLRSYRTILEQAMKDQVESLLVFDDDVLMHKRTPELFESVSRQLPDDWLLLQLGTLQYNWKSPWFEPVSEHLYRTRGSAIGSHAVGMRFDMMPYLLDHASRMDLPFDVGALSAATQAFSNRSFITLPNLAIQRLGAGSDINTSDFQKQTDIAEVAKTYRWNLEDYFEDN